MGGNPGTYETGFVAAGTFAPGDSDAVEHAHLGRLGLQRPEA
jgi:hypothetical protein